MFNRILIANRGEIACRIIRTARRLGIRTVAVYSEADRGALHVELADEALPIGPPPAVESYLSIAKLVTAGKEARVDAVHPGYGFLSENADFARAVIEAGFVFIGPNPSAIAAMGDKIAAKTMAAKAGVSIVPGQLGTIADEAEAMAAAGHIGYPVMIKAAAGGGGKGMRVAKNESEVGEALARARSEAKSAFGDERLFLEKYLENPRHIEIQVLGDKFGNVIHLGERECSIQRRNQKIVEEAPSQLVDEAMRSRMGTQAVALAKAVGYDSAGTVEFVATNDRKFYFLEMNTRLQVEHPVTEFVTGIDLVEQMIRIAAGEKLGLSQTDVSLEGWAVESRIYAEDPSRNFLPSIGRLTKFRPPLGEAEGQVGSIRVDTGVEEGEVISVHYDPMIAKLITHGATRELAVAAQADALDSFIIDGIRHNVPFLAALMAHPRWQAGHLSTSFIPEEFPDGFHPREPAGESAQVLAAVAAHLDFVLRERRQRFSGQESAAPERSAGERVVRFDKAEMPLEIERTGEGFSIRFRGSSDVHQLESSWKPGDRLWRGHYDENALVVQVRSVLNTFDLFHHGIATRVHVYSLREAEAARLMPAQNSVNSGKSLRCPMPGLVVSIAVAAGQEVKAGEALAVIEAMKMENVLRADRDGVVRRVLVKPGETLAVDQVILEFA